MNNINQTEVNSYMGSQHMVEYKIQTASINGWADLKYSEDDGITYNVEAVTLQDGENEVRQLISDLDGSADEYRMVPFNTPSDDDLYT